MVDVRRLPALHLPALAHDFVARVRHHQHRRHAERVRHREIAGEVLEHRRLCGIDAVAGEETVVVLRKGLRLQFARDDVEHVLEMVVDGEAAHHRVGVGLGAVRQDELAARQLFQRGAERRIGLERRMIDRVDVFEIGVGVHAVLEHEAAQAGAVALVEILLDAEGVVGRHAEKIRDVGADAVVDLLPQVEVMGIERVVEVEHPCLRHGRNRAFRGLHSCAGF